MDGARLFAAALILGAVLFAVLWIVLNLVTPDGS
jgi:hypothetical protein